jgi:DNA mismatch repair ATPase MutS
MDELGRGTSLIEGMAIAFASLHSLHHVVQCRTLFATHYHELAELLKKNWKSTSFLKTRLFVDDSVSVVCNV